MGRNPKPIDQVKGHRTKDEIADRKEKEEALNSRLSRDKIKPPTWLSKEGKSFFKKLVVEFEHSELLTNLDVNALAVYCDAYCRMLDLRKDVEANGRTLTNHNSSGGKTFVANPSLTALNATIKTLQSYESKFGLTVYDRTRIALSDSKPEEDDEVTRDFGNI